MDIQEEIIFFPSEQLSLEGRFAYDDNLSSPLAKALICPPHPFLGGDMDNNVVKQLNYTLAEAGFTVFRFNYRGIGKSESDRDLQQDQKEFWEHSTCPDYEAGIHLDCRSALQWLENTLDRSMPIYLVAYSFGCLPALSLSSNSLINKLVLISPPLSKWKINTGQFERPIPRSLFFATGDFACPEKDIEMLYAQMPEPKSINRFQDADHFFIGQEKQLAESVSQFLVSND
jgi:uncharacterized protein